MRQIKVPLIQRFEASYTPEPNTGCWLWTRFTDKDGYGFINTCTIKYKSNSTRAHRLSYSLFKGAIPKGMCVLHKCDQPSCVNPEHLFLGTHRDNQWDKVHKGRHHNQIKVTCKVCLGPLEKLKGHRSRRCRACYNKNALKNYYRRRKENESTTITTTTNGSTVATRTN